MCQLKTTPLPKTWPKQVKSAVIHTLSFATTDFMAAYGRRSEKVGSLSRVVADLALAKRESAILKKEIRLKDSRFGRVPPHRRPYYRSTERLQVLQIRTARGWSIAQTAETFLLNENTVASWHQRIDEEGESALLQTPVPVNKFPNLVRAIVRHLKVFFPNMGKDRIANAVARAGLHLGATTVGRMIDEHPSRPANDGSFADGDPEVAVQRVVTSKYPDHIWCADLTVAPTSSGFRVPWLPHS